jgi:thiol-disulfide isomerase/thioredoxin
MTAKRVFATLVFLQTLVIFEGGAYAQTCAKLQDCADFSFSGNALPSLLVKDLEGVERRIGDVSNGKFLLLSMWATWCHTCKRDMPHLDYLAGILRAKGNFDVLALSEDAEPAAVYAFNKRYDIKNMDTYLDIGRRAMRELGIKGVPSSIIFSPDGREIFRINGEADWNSPDASEFLFSFVGNSSATRLFPQK